MQEWAYPWSGVTGRRLLGAQRDVYFCAISFLFTCWDGELLVSGQPAFLSLGRCTAPVLVMQKAPALTAVSAGPHQRHALFMLQLRLLPVGMDGIWLRTYLSQAWSFLQVPGHLPQSMSSQKLYMGFFVLLAHSDLQ
ncbi:hypothetical protein NDU88_000456 [Pleurodeles waltl]|uniref:Uncharacterized protein n=1 Tax=Pleurodeles waltl TaxID=8319 RepID=A0AAV7TEY3_PLEWA|nr:hypothetical protein NDU88_000456 [Pleurodeles waltl]